LYRGLKMKASVYIIKLQALIDKHGDLPLYYYQDGQMDFFEIKDPCFLTPNHDDWLKEDAIVSCNSDTRYLGYV
jgi:hypothetical protein